MSSLGSPSPFLFGGKKIYEVERSLRFNRDDNAYLSRTPSSAGNRKTFTYSAWVKLGQTGVNSSTNPGNGLFLSCGPAGTGTNMALRITNSGYIGVDYYGIGGYYSSARLRDPSAWYHCVWVMDTTESTAANRFKVYVNGNLIYNNQIGLSQNADTPLNNNSLTTIGAYSYSTSNAYRLDAYLTEVHFLDGYAYDPSYFAETNSTTGQWNPKEYTGSYGSNGFYLNFSDNSGTTATTMGKDSSNNSNNFTPNNFVTGDAVKDSPTNNFAVLNPLSKSSGITVGECNLYAQGSSGWRTVVGNFHMSSGKWYWEIHIKQVGNSIYGILPATRANGRQDFYADIYTGSYSDEWGYSAGGTLYNSASGTSNWGSTYTVGDILGFALDMDNGTLDIKKNGSTTGSQITGISTSKEYRAAFTYYSSGTKSNINFGQDSTFAGQKTAQGNTDGSGQGDFYYAPPSGYKALCSANLADPTIKLPNKHFDTLLYAGNGSSPRTITGLQFSPDFVWLKHRNSTSWHRLQNSVVGANKLLYSNSTNAEATDEVNGHLNSFTSDGFIIDDPNSDGLNNNSGTYVGWNWNAGDTDGKTYVVKVHDFSGNNRYIFDDFQTQAVTLDLAEGGTYIFNMDDASNASHPFSIGTAANGTVYTSGITYFLDGVSKTYSEYTSGFSAASTRRLHITVPASAPVLYYWCSVHSGMGGQINTNTTLGSSNFDGTIQSVVKASPTTGFSIVSYEGNNVQGATVGHGLGVAPSVVIVKNRETSYNWAVWHQGLTSAAYVVYLNLNNAQGSVPGIFNSTLPTSTVFSLGGGSQADRFLSNEPNKDFIAYIFSEVAGYSKFGSYTGNGSSDGTFIFTGFRPSFVIQKRTNTTGHWYIFDDKRNGFNVDNDSLSPNLSDAEYDVTIIDLLSNGFKFRTNAAAHNGSGGTYIYLAFAESPFKNARAR